MLLSFTVYISLALTLFLLGWHAKVRDASRTLAGLSPLPFYCWEILVSLVVIAVVFGIRMNTGSDHLMYLSQYFSVSKNGSFLRPEGMEFVFEWITKVFAALKCHFTVYFGFWALLQAALLYFGLRKHKFLLPWLGLLLILGPYSINWFSFMRQWVVTFGCVAIIPLIVDRKFGWYALAVVLLSTIHLSALLLLLAYFLPFNRIAALSRKWLLVIFVLFTLLGLYPVWILHLKPLLKVLPMMGYMRYSALTADLMNGHLCFLAFGPLHLISIFTQLVAIWYFPQVKAYRSTDRMLPVFFSFAFVASCYERMMINTAHYMIRPADLFFVCILIVVAYVTDFLYAHKRYAELAVCLIPIISYVLINVVKSHFIPGDLNEVVNYHFFFIR